MARNNTKRKSTRALRSGVLYCCGKCGTYYMRKDGETTRSMWSPCPSVTPVTRTCDDCRRLQR